MTRADQQISNVINLMRIRILIIESHFEIQKLKFESFQKYFKR